MRYTILALAGSVGIAPAAWASDCQIFPACDANAPSSGNHSSKDQTTSCFISKPRSLEMTVSENSTCQYTFYVDPQSSIKVFEVRSKPRNGLAGRSNRYTIAYQPTRNFSGNDNFSVYFSGNVQGVATEFTFDVNVNVIPGRFQAQPQLQVQPPFEPQPQSQPGRRDSRR